MINVPVKYRSMRFVNDSLALRWIVFKDEDPNTAYLILYLCERKDMLIQGCVQLSSGKYIAKRINLLAHSSRPLRAFASFEEAANVVEALLIMEEAMR